jgi:hypothetical protein
MIPLPNLVQQFVTKGLNLASPWNFYLQQFTQAPPNIADVTLSASPFSYTSKEPGNVSVTGGTVSAITLTRGQITIDVTGMKLIPVAIEDTITVTYSVLPTIKFLANYGQNTGAQ